MNPELIRNWRLELSPARLALMLVGVVAIALLVVADETPHDAADGLHGWFRVLFYLTAGVWGTRRAAAAITEEVAQGTWDAQRMSAMGPWTLTWGKLFGATAQAWVVGLVCLGLSLAGPALFDPSLLSRHEQVHTAAFDLLLVFGGQAVALASALALLALDRARHAQGATLAQTIALAVGANAFTAAIALAERDTPLNWWGLPLSGSQLALLGLALFALSGVLVAWRLMRQELSHFDLPGSLPWGWLGMSGLGMAYAAGLAGGIDDPTFRHSVGLAAAYGVAAAATYVAILFEPKDPLRLKALNLRWREGKRAETLALLPGWAVTLPLAALCAIALALVGEGLAHELGRQMFDDDSLEQVLRALIQMPLLGLLFILRDLLVAHLVFTRWAGRRPRRAPLMTLTVLLIAYLLLPAILLGLGWQAPRPFLVPALDLGWGIAVGAPLLEIALLAILVWRPWRRPPPRKGQA
ncbi:hypothetical protein [Roseospirillum parvum]|uniref:Uncharacterized protein n=1 Tax=Roseospirillum parvum TaxID=83401 RepID=A0A1G7VDJ9_9PROT|nr:hypothetical protein [Roseospirillum parvum]SDG57020.1 hypothetical protein SAMN05421742_101603 [Roseospirillum parvum]